MRVIFRPKKVVWGPQTTNGEERIIAGRSQRDCRGWCGLGAGEVAELRAVPVGNVVTGGPRSRRRAGRGDGRVAAAGGGRVAVTRVLVSQGCISTLAIADCASACYRGATGRRG